VCVDGPGWSESVPVDTHGEKPSPLHSFSVPDILFSLADCPAGFKFGKGKHSSLTKANMMLWQIVFAVVGQIAGWAHSVLFTADLKAFSERLVAKAEVKEESQSVKSEARRC